MHAINDLQAAPAGARVLVVDDDANNRELRRDLLEFHGYGVDEAGNGEAALACLATSAPHVVLLDVMMPGMDGFEVCRRIKANPQTAAIPVLMITALAGREDRLRGMASGATDYLTKPLDREDIMLRVRNAVLMKRLYDQELESLARLRQLEMLRDNLVHMTIHDMRSPLTSMCINLELVLDHDHLGRLGADDVESLRTALYSSRELVEMVTSILDISRLEAGQMPLHKQSVDLVQVASDAVTLLGGMADLSPVHLEYPREPVIAWCDPEIIRRVIVNLLGNALKFSPVKQSVTVHLDTPDGQARVSIVDHGPGIPAEFHHRIFEKFGRVETLVQNRRRLPSTGLGLTFCKLAVAAHGGSIGLLSEVDQGSTFWFRLPANGDNDTARGTQAV